MTNSIQKLLDFIVAAERSRKYLPNVAINHRTPLRLIDPELNEEEGKSVDTLKSNLDQIFHTVYLKNQAKMSASSIEVYKRRVRSVISDYEKYGTDLSKMASWNPTQITRTKKTESKKLEDHTTVLPQQELGKQHYTENMIELGEFKLVLPATWDLIRAKKSVPIGEFKAVYDELTNLSAKFETENNSEIKGGMTER